MKFKYNIALLPLKKSEEIIGYAKNLSIVASQYILNANSHPHTTICQFEAEESELFGHKPLDLTFDNLAA